MLTKFMLAPNNRSTQAAPQQFLGFRALEKNPQIGDTEQTKINYAKTIARNSAMRTKWFFA
jgi:hypothetical protein